MISAELVGRSESTEREIKGHTVVIRDRFGHPIVLVVEVAPGQNHVYSVAIDEQKFRKALDTFGIPLNAKVVDIKV